MSDLVFESMKKGNLPLPHMNTCSPASWGPHGTRTQERWIFSLFWSCDFQFLLCLNTRTPGSPVWLQHLYTPLPSSIWNAILPAGVCSNSAPNLYNFTFSQSLLITHSSTFSVSWRSTANISIFLSNYGLIKIDLLGQVRVRWGM